MTAQILTDEADVDLAGLLAVSPGAEQTRHTSMGQIHAHPGRRSSPTSSTMLWSDLGDQRDDEPG